MSVDRLVQLKGNDEVNLMSLGLDYLDMTRSEDLDAGKFKSGLKLIELED